MQRSFLVSFTSWGLCAVALVAGCGGGDSDPEPEQTATGGTAGTGGQTLDSAVDTSAGGTQPLDGSHDQAVVDSVGSDATEEPFDECTAGTKLCLNHDTARACEGTAAGTRWVQRDCEAGQGCVAGECVSGKCSDECNLGDTQSGKSCELWNLANGTWSQVDAAGSMHDRARAYNMWLRRDGLIEGGVGNALYSDPGTFANRIAMGGIGDSAIWTGTYLAAEAFRLRATGSSDARDNIKQLVNTLHLWFNVTGQPGMLARFAAPSNTPRPAEIGDLQCTDEVVHCGVEFEGSLWDYRGHISRDQYQGVMLGYALAYEALGPTEEPTRELIRQDVVELVQELMLERQVPVQITYNGTPIPRFNATMRFVVLSPAEMSNGAIRLSISASGNYDDSDIWGFQEFIPDLSDLIHQIPGMGWTPAVPRASSAIMLASFFRVGMLVTEGVPGYETANADIKAYYTGHTGDGGNISDWLDVAATYAETNQCGDHYYGHNISMEPMYNLARLEDDAALSSRVTGEVLTNKMWPLFDTTKNCFFSYIFAGTVPGADPQVATLANQQLAQFPPPPRVVVPVDLRDDPIYQPHQDGCTDQVNHDGAVDVGQRVVSDFIWQRHPWGLYDTGNPAQTMPGVDYLTAYWMGRFHGFFTDDKDGSCLAWH